MTGNAIAALLTLVFVLAGAIGFGRNAWDALRSGIYPQRGGGADRDRQPVSFWLWVGLDAAAVLLLAAIGAYAAWRLATGR